MNPTLRRFLAAAALAAGLSATLRAQAPEPIVILAGTTTESPLDGSRWGYLSWLASTPELLRDRAYAVYIKDGGPDSLFPYRHLGTVRPQTDPSAIKVMFERSRHLGQDPDKLGDSITAYFDQLHPDAAIPVADMLGALTAQSLQDDAVFQMLVFMGRAHPGVALSLGTGFAARIPAGPSTFELREKPPGSDEFSAVVGRVTLDAAQPFVFTPPGPPVMVPSTDRNANALPDADATNHMNLKLRWASPPELRRQSVLLRGFHVFRVTRAYAEARGWNGCPAPPTLASVDWTAEVESAFPQVARVNRLPILPRRYYDSAEVTDFNLDDTDGIKGDLDFYTQDDNRHNGLQLDDDGNGIDLHDTFVPGAEFYYFVAAEDLVGRLGATSCGTLLKICDRDPPLAPKGVQVTNDFSFDNASQTSDQRLRVTWKQMPASEGVVAYFVYRWRSLPDLKAAELLDPLTLGPANLVAGPIPHTQPGAALSVIDNADPAHSPKIGADPQFGAPGDDAGRTIWYTVVAVDDSTCGGNFSPHSAPADGVLRDRVAPLDGDGALAITCCTPILTPEQDQSTETGSTDMDPGRMYFKLVVNRDGPQPEQLRTVEFWLQNTRDQSILPVGSDDFPANPADPAERLEFYASIPRPEPDDIPYILHGKVIQADGRESDIASVTIQSLPPLAIHYGTFTAIRDCPRRFLRSEQDLCRTHEATPSEGGSMNPIGIQLEFATGAREWRLYRTIDDGPLTLIRQATLPTPTTPGQVFDLTDIAFSPAGGEVCYFVQYFDEHGNAGPMKDIGCVKFTGKPPPAPVLARIQPLEIGGVRKARLRWFCPTAGVERFEVRATRKPGPIPENLSAALTHVGSGLMKIPGDDGPTIVQAAKRYETGIVGHTLPHNGPAFSILLDEIEMDALHHVRVTAIGTNGLKSDASNTIAFVWESPEEIILPEVAWPARPLPPGTKPIDWDSRIEVTYLHHLLPNYTRVGVRIGRTYGARTCGIDPFDFNPADPVFALPGNIDPLTAIFAQGDWIASPGVPPPPRLLPGMLYRYQVPNSLFDEVSNDLVQVTPLMENIVHRYETPVAPPLNNCNGVRIYDPYIAITSGTPHGITGFDLAFDVWLLDSMPVTRGASYAYLLVVFRENGEIRTVIPAGTVEIPISP